jgi:hypothetical protein
MEDRTGRTLFHRIHKEHTMDVMGIAKLSTSLADNGTRQDVAMAMLKKSQDVQASTAASLLAALPPVQASPSLPAHLGNTINTTA